MSELLNYFCITKLGVLRLFNSVLPVSSELSFNTASKNLPLDINFVLKVLFCCCYTCYEICESLKQISDSLLENHHH